MLFNSMKRIQVIFILFWLISTQPSFSQSWDRCDNTNSFYLYQGMGFDLGSMSWATYDDLPYYTFKTCSGFKHLFINYTEQKKITYEGTVFEIKDGDEMLVVSDGDSGVTSSVCIRQSEYSDVYLMETSNGIVLVSNCWSEYFTAEKYDRRRKSQARTNRNDFAAQKLDQYGSRYEGTRKLRYNTGQEFIFETDTLQYSDIGGCLVFTLSDFSVKTYPFKPCGYAMKQDGNGYEGLFYKKDNMSYFQKIGSNEAYQLDSTEYFDQQMGIIVDNKLIVTTYSPISTGSKLWCYDLDKKTMLWKAEVDQLNVPHSKYFNHVYLSLYKTRIILEGDEAGGDYLQIFDLETGKKLFSDIKKR